MYNNAQSVKNTDTAENKWYDAWKKISWIKRHIAVDTQWLPHAIHITRANVTDRDWAIEMFEISKENLKAVEKTLTDWWYTWEKFVHKVKEIIGSTVEVAKWTTYIWSYTKPN